MPGPQSGFVRIVASTAVAGVAGYIVTWLVFRLVGAADYAEFMVFWSTLYLIVGTLSGIQQEITRATRLRRPGSLVGASKSRNFGVVAAAIVLVVILSSSPLWATSVFQGASTSLVWPLALGATAYVLVATLCGALYGIAEWRALGWIVATDGVLRLVLLIVVSLFSTELDVLAWAVVAPFPLTLLLLWPFVRHSVVGRVETDVGYRRLAWNVARTILAAASTGFLVTGFPLLLRITSPSEPAATLGVFILAITLTRAPLIVTVMSLQSYLVVRFRDFSSSFWRLFLSIQAIVIGGGVVLALLGWLVGPAVFVLLFGAESRLQGLTIAVLVLSSALVAALSVSAAAVLARSQHIAYSMGWLVAAATTVAILLMPVDFVPRVLATLIVGPLAGLIVHAVLLVTRSRASSTRVRSGG